MITTISLLALGIVIFTVFFKTINFFEKI